MIEVFALTAQKVAVLLIFIGIGYFLRRHHDLPDDAGRVLSLLCTLLFAPAYSISNFSKSLTRDVFVEKLGLIGYGVLFILFAIGLAFLLARLLAKESIVRKSLIYAFAIPNYGYFGYPVIEGVFGSELLADVMIFLIPLSLATYSFGYALFMDGKKLPLKKVLLNPMIFGLVIGAAIGLSGVKLPIVLSSAISGAGACMSPCSMLLAGFMLGKFPLKNLLTGWKPYAYTAVRMVLIPLIFAGILLLCGMQGKYLMYPLLIAGIPLGLNLVVFPESQGFEKQASENAKLCFVSYLLALIILPITFALLANI